MATRTWILGVAAATLLLAAGAACQKSSAGSAGVAASDAKVASVVFIDKQDACDCTRKRADDSYASLESALGAGASIPVDRIYIDSDKERAAPYLEMQAVMVIPGIYFLDGKGGLVAMLQGEQTADNLSAALGK